MLNPHLPVYNASVFYILLVVGLVIMKPTMLYDHDKKKFREFGMDEGKAVVTLPVLSISCAIVIYFLFSLVEAISDRSKKK